MRGTVVVMALVVMLAGGCRSTGKNTLAPDTMKVVMWDLLKMDELYVRMTSKDSTLLQKRDNIRLYEEVFALHHITREQFKNTYKFYESHPIEFKTLLDSVEAYAERERSRANPVPVK